jgi:hypothetical protein
MAPTFEQVSDGCICGKIENGTWIADPAGKVSVPAGTDPAMAQEICRVAAKHYAAQREDEAAAKSAKAGSEDRGTGGGEDREGGREGGGEVHEDCGEDRDGGDGQGEDHGESHGEDRKGDGEDRSRRRTGRRQGEAG